MSIFNKNNVPLNKCFFSKRCSSSAFSSSLGTLSMYLVFYLIGNYLTRPPNIIITRKT